MSRGGRGPAEPAGHVLLVGAAAGPDDAAAEPEADAAEPDDDAAKADATEPDDAAAEPNAVSRAPRRGGTRDMDVHSTRCNPAPGTSEARTDTAAQPSWGPLGPFSGPSGGV